MRFNSHSKAAFTMVELMGAVTIAMVLIFLMYGLFDKVQTVFVAGQNRAWRWRKVARRWI